MADLGVVWGSFKHEKSTNPLSGFELPSRNPGPAHVCSIILLFSQIHVSRSVPRTKRKYNTAKSATTRSHSEAEGVSTVFFFSLAPSEPPREKINNVVFEH